MLENFLNALFYRKNKFPYNACSEKRKKNRGHFPIEMLKPDLTIEIFNHITVYLTRKIFFSGAADLINSV